MSRFNTPHVRPAGTSPVTTTGVATRTFEGATGYLRDEKSELFLLAVSNLVGQDTFYESGGQRDDRYTQLIRELAVSAPEWTAGLLGWLRDDGNMRTASLVGAAEFAKARLDAKLDGQSRQVIDSVLQRPDEPGELLAYWTSRYGRNLSKPVKRGIADAVQRLYSERALLKYDTDSKGYRFGDVLELVHAAPATGRRWQGDLFKHAIDRRHGRDTDVPGSLSTIVAREQLMATPVDQRRTVVREHPDLLQHAGMTWEALAGWLQGPMDAAAWEAVIPSMGYMALLRNLRNFDQAGVSDEVAEQVAAKLANPTEVARSRQFPFRFYSAHKNTASLRWGHALEKSLRSSLANVPSLTGRTLVCIDQSPSMFPGYVYSTRTDSDIALAEKAALFGAALALRAESADLVGYGMSHYPVQFQRGDAILTVMGRFRMDDGTDTPRAIADNYRGHDRVVVVTDEQTAYSRTGHTVDTAVPANVPVYTWNLAGYRVGHGPSGSRNRHTFGGLTDHAFRMVPLLEAGRNASWPWEKRG
jgi:hypothetical protein